MADPLLGPEHKVLVVGSLMHRAWEPYRAHPQVLFWTGDRSEVRRKLKRNGHATFLPMGVKVILLSRFVGHRESDPIRKEAKRYGPSVVGPLDDGDITRQLATLIPLQSTLPDTPTLTVPTHTVVEGFDPNDGRPEPLNEVDRVRGVPAPTLRPFKPGEQRVFVEQHYRPGPSQTGPEVRRLHQLALSMGLQTTEQSLQVSLNHLRHRLGIVKSPQARGKAAVEALHAAPASPVATPSPPSAPVVARPPSPFTDPTAVVEVTDDPLVKMIDDAIAGLVLVREEVARFRQDKQDYLTLKAKLAELLR